MYLLVEYQEGFVNLARNGHITCATVEDDYYNPVVIVDTREELIEWIKDNRQGSKMEVNGDTITIERRSWQGEIKGIDIYHMVKVEKGKAIVY